MEDLSFVIRHPIIREYLKLMKECIYADHDRMLGELSTRCKTPKDDIDRTINMFLDRLDGPEDLAKYLIANT